MNDTQQFLESRRNYGIRPGLQRINALLSLLGNPEKDMKVIHIAGTNGKGSTLTYLKAALMENGYNVGTFSSPALETFHEQIKINDELISEEELSRIIKEITSAIDTLDKAGEHPTEFEITVVIAILYMQNRVDLAIFEAGMGGKEDSTNCIAPLLTIITNVEKDHMSFLGSTHAEIAAHKAGIIKPGIPVITGLLNQESQKIVKKEAETKHAPLYQLDQRFFIKDDSVGKGFTFEMDDWKPYLPFLSMPGKHQIMNASLALAALYIMKGMEWKIDMGRAQTAVQQATLSGRFETINENPLVVVDGAHNPAGIKSFVKTVKEQYPDKNWHLVFAVFEDKDLEGMISQFEDFSTVTFTSFSHPRAAPAEAVYRKANFSNKRLDNDWKAALGHLLQEATMDDVILAAGSLHFINNVKSWLEKRA